MGKVSFWPVWIPLAHQIFFIFRGQKHELRRDRLLVGCEELHNFLMSLIHIKSVHALLESKSVQL